MAEENRQQPLAWKIEVGPCTKQGAFQDRFSAGRKGKRMLVTTSGVAHNSDLQRLKMSALIASLPGNAAVRVWLPPPASATGIIHN